MRIRRTLYGWRAPAGGYCLSKLPLDVPLMPIDPYPSIKEAEIQAELRRAKVIWCGSALIERQSLGLDERAG